MEVNWLRKHHISRPCHSMRVENAFPHRKLVLILMIREPSTSQTNTRSVVSVWWIFSVCFFQTNAFQLVFFTVTDEKVRSPGLDLGLGPWNSNNRFNTWIRSRCVIWVNLKPFIWVRAFHRIWAQCSKLLGTTWICYGIGEKVKENDLLKKYISVSKFKFQWLNI